MDSAMPLDTPQSIWGRISRALLAIFFLGVLGIFAVVPLDWKSQAIVGGLLFLGAWILNRSARANRATLALIVLSTFATTRYAYWRIWQTVTYVRSDQPYKLIDLVFVALLLVAELYAFLELYLGFFQTIRPLHRAPVALPQDPAEWPSVDVYIPTYNEDLDLVRYTVIAALNMDWPADKLQVYVLDDGNREEFREFAAEIGSGYIARPVHNHAKAGNINFALNRTTGDYIAIFDSDHIPTRSFLQITMGWFLKDHRLGLLQTPHHFYSPDPFERNLSQFRRIPNEGELFYGLVQDGNDFWNAAFFCGSCAVIRRTALQEIGGIAVETVTEDAHTSLRLQRNGWNTAYINIPQAAGLATESLSGHIGQRIRWARGMIQILRLDNPLFGPGLKFPQRLCYFNAMLHFLYAVPRLIFLTSPLVYLLLGHSNFFGYWVTIFAYALPHILLSNLTNSRMQGRYRFSFWNEIYEAVLAPYILLPTLVALISPGKGKFNVTAKGGLVETTYFDRRMAWPYLFLLGLNVLGLAVAVPRFLYWNVDHQGTVLLNVLWTLYNVMILSVATAVACETRQRRADVRVDVETPFALLLGNNQIVRGSTLDLSNKGVQAELEESCPVKVGEAVRFVLASPTAEATFTGYVVGKNGLNLRVRLDTLSLAQEEALTRLLYSRADSWIGWRDQRASDRPLRSLFLIFRISLRGFALAVSGLLSRGPAAPYSAAEQRAREVKARAVASGVQRALIFAIAMVLLSNFSSLRSNAQELRSKAGQSSPSAGSAEFSDVYDLPALGQRKPVLLRGAEAEFRLNFGIPITKVVSSATLILRYQAAPELVAGDSKIQLRLNGAELQPVPIVQSGEGTASEASISLPADLLTSDNELVFHLLGRLSGTPDNAPVLTRIEGSTQIALAGSILPLANNLGLLPAPFFDRSNNRPLQLPFVFATQPSRSALKAAGIVASYFGVMTDNRGAHFPTYIRDLPAGNCVYFVERSADQSPALKLAELHGPVIAMRSNPTDNYGKVLVVMGNSGEELLTAARALALQQFVRSGDSSTITDFRPAPPLSPNTAPRWLRTDRPAPIADYASQDQLQVYGTGAVDIYFRVPPDLYFGDKETIPLHLKYRYGGITSGNVGTLTVKLNGAFVGAVRLSASALSATQVLSTTLPVPVGAFSDFGNTLTAEFSFGGEGPSRQTLEPENLFGAIQKDSTLDLRGISHFAELPNLALFSDAGFPFTRFPDLSRTAVVLPNAATAEEVSLYLAVLAAMGAHTGYPSIGVEVGSASNLGEFRGRHLLVIGTPSDQPLIPRWENKMPLTMDSAGFQIRETNTRLETAKGWLDEEFRNQRQQLADLLNGPTLPSGVAAEFESPEESGRTVVLLASRDASAAGALSAYVMPAGLEGRVSGNLSFINNERFESFQWNQRPYFIGDLGWFGLTVFWITRYYVLLPIGILALSLVLAGWMNEGLRRKAALRLRVQNS
jgi:cellulose synthase (UDP-forming)